MNNRAWHVWGISELSCWLGHRNPVCASPSGHDAEECLDAHLGLGIRHVVWDVGRSVLAYHSDLPGATCMGLRPPPPGMKVEAALVEALYGQRCQLRAALRHARRRGITLYGRLCMNRHYAPGSAHRSAFADTHPQWCELRQDGWLDPTRLCYGIPEVRRERIDILLEIADIGVDGIQLDFCRQPPLVGYHAAFVNSFIERHAVSPRQLQPSDGEAYHRWCAHRAEAVTDLLRELHAELTLFRERWQRPLPVQVRIPNDGFEANLAAGLDLRTWCAEGLIDEIALSELRWHPDFRHWDDAPYIELGQAHNLPVLGSSNCLPRQGATWKDGTNWSGKVNPHGINPLVLARRALRSYQQGADGIALYQSDTGIQRTGLAEAVGAMRDPQSLRAYVEKPEHATAYPVTGANTDFGIDNHSAALHPAQKAADTPRSARTEPTAEKHHTG